MVQMVNVRFLIIDEEKAYLDLHFDFIEDDYGTYR
jgi:hypothetical protein